MFQNSRSVMSPRKSDYFSDDDSILITTTDGIYLMLYGYGNENMLEIAYYRDIEDGGNTAKVKWHTKSIKIIVNNSGL